MENPKNIFYVNASDIEISSCVATHHFRPVTLRLPEGSRAQFAFLLCELSAAAQQWQASEN